MQPEDEAPDTDPEWPAMVWPCQFVLLSSA